MRSYKQPFGMYVLGATEVFERMSFYTLIFQIFLFASASFEKGGLGWGLTDALALSTTYSATAYTFPIFASFFIDKFLGIFRSVIFGAALIILGQASIFIVGNTSTPLFLASVSLIVLGTAFFKPCMPVLLGKLYTNDDPRRGPGFNLYYGCINMGALIASYVSGYLHQGYGFRASFASAGIGMVLGVCVLWMGRGHLKIDPRLDNTSKPIDTLPQKLEPAHKKAFMSFGIAFLFFFMWAIIYNICNAGPTMLLLDKFTQKTIAHFHTIFFSIDNYDIPTEYFNSINSITLILMAPLSAFFFTSMAKRGKEIHAYTQVGIALIIATLSVIFLNWQLKGVVLDPNSNLRPLFWYHMSLFIIISSISEAIISPAMLSVITVISPEKYQARFQGIYLLGFGISAEAARRLTNATLIHPYQTLLLFSCLFGAITILYFFILKPLINSIKNLALNPINK